MTPNQWGPPTWTMFHTFIEKIKEDSFKEIGPQLFSHIFRICGYLPCPDCSKHATAFLSKVPSKALSTKMEMKNTFYVFHNVVNKRKNKPLHNYENMEKYKSNNIFNCFNNFVSIYHTKGNMKLLTETFQRQLIIADFKKWIEKNHMHFDK